MIKGVIFDVDGVILDSMSIWEDLGVRYLKNNGIIAEDGLSDILFSMSMEQGAEYLSKEYDVQKTPEEILKDLKNLLADFYYYEVGMKSGVEELLNFLKNKNINLIIASSSPEEHIKRALNRNNILNYFSDILTTSEIGESKHNPLIYNKCAELLGTQSNETAVFEDSLYAIRTAKNSGFIAVGVYDEFSKEDEKEARQSSNFYINRLTDFIEIFNSMN